MINIKKEQLMGSDRGTSRLHVLQLLDFSVTLARNTSESFQCSNVPFALVQPLDLHPR